MTGEELNDYWKRLDSLTEPWRTHWRELAKYVQPRRYQDMTTSPAASARTQPDTHVSEDLFDSTAVDANLILARGQLAWMTPRGNPWFSYTAPADVEETDAVRDYLGRCTEIARLELAASNFYTQAFNMYLDRGAFGTACFSKFREDGRFIFRCEKDFVCEEGPNDTIDTVMVRRVYSHRQAAGFFNREDDTLPEEVMKFADDPQKSGETNEFIHAAYPNPEADPTGELAKHLPYVLHWIHKPTGQTVRKSYATESPYLVTRFLTWSERNPQAPYGWCPSFQAVPEMRFLNRLVQLQISALDLSVNPRVLVPRGMRGRVDLRPGGMTSLDDSGQRPEEWLTGSRIDLAVDYGEMIRGKIRKAFMADLFQMFSELDRKDMTATEVQARLGEKLDNASPTFDLFNIEIAEPLGRWVFATLAEEGAFPTDVPPELGQQDGDAVLTPIPNMEFSNRISLAIRSGQDRAALEAVSTLLPFAEFDPSVTDQFNLPEISRDYFRSVGAKQDRLRSPAEVKRIDQNRQQQAQEIAQAQGQLPA